MFTLKMNMRIKLMQLIMNALFVMIILPIAHFVIIHLLECFVLNALLNI